jgi:hypothetical protein
VLVIARVAFVVMRRHYRTVMLIGRSIAYASRVRLGRFEVDRGEGRLTLTTSREDRARAYTWFVLILAVVTEAMAVFRIDFAYVILAASLAMLAFFWSLVVADRVSANGRYIVVRRRIEIKRASEAANYRERAGATLTVDDETFDAARVRGLFRRVRNERNHTTYQWLILALDDRVFEVEESTNHAGVGALAEALRKELELPVVQTPKDPELALGSAGGMVLVILVLPAVFVPALAPASFVGGNLVVAHGLSLIGPPAVIAIAWGAGRLLAYVARGRPDQLAETYGITPRA